MGGGSAAMGISTGQITSALSTQNRTLSPITSQRCQLIQSACPSSDADHSHHRQLIIEKMRHFTLVGRAGAACWCVTVLHIASQWSDLLYSFTHANAGLTSVKVESHFTHLSLFKKKTAAATQLPLLTWKLIMMILISRL